MKKILLITIMAMILFSFTACGKKNKTEEQTTKEVTEVHTTTEEAIETPATEAPTEVATEKPTEAPTQAPTEKPTEAPTQAPTETPTQASSFNPKEDFKPGMYGFAGEANWEGYTDAIVVYGISFSEEGTIFGYVWGLYVREDDPSAELSSEVYHYNGAKYYRSSSAMLGMDPMIGTYSLTDEAINVEYTYISSTPCSGVFVMTSDKSIKSEEANPIAAAGQELVLYEGN